MDRRVADVALVISLLVGGCGRTEPPPPATTTAPPSAQAAGVSAAPAPSATAPPPSSPSATRWAFSPPPAAEEPTVPPGLGRTASATRDGMRVTVTLQRNPMPAGEMSWVRTMVTNVGTTTATWFHDGCATSVGVDGVFDADWRDGTEHRGQAQAFKDAVLGKDFGKSAYDRPFLSFVPRKAIGRGSYGCADIGIGEQVRPGATLKATRWWSGVDPATKAPPPGGSVSLDVWSGYFWRGAEPEHIGDARITFSLEAWVTGGWSPSRPSPREIVDAALADASFVAFLGTQTLHTGREEILWYDAPNDRWEVGVMPWYETEPPRIHGLLVDAATGAVLGPLDRAWDEAVDGFPY